jgi:hypothetical protein
MRRVCFLILLAFDSSSANAGLLFHTYEGESIYESTNNLGFYGTQFTVGSEDVEISQLGVYDNNGDGLANTHNVGVWDLSGTLLASQSFLGTEGVLIEDWRFLAISSSITLSANTSYRIAAETTGTTHASDGQPFSGTVLTNSSVTRSNGSYFHNDPTGLNFPDIFNAHNRVFGNAFIASAPEPGSVAFLSLGLVCYGFAIYRRKNRQAQVG